MAGYPQEAAALARVALERAFQQTFIGVDQERAQRWRNHSNEATNFVSFYDSVESTMKLWFPDASVEERKDMMQDPMGVYQEISAFAHGNPFVTKGIDVRELDGEAVMAPMPHFTVRGFVMCGRALLAAHQSAELALAAYVEAFIPEQEQDVWKDTISELAGGRALAGVWFSRFSDDAGHDRLQRMLDAARDGTQSGTTWQA